MRNTKWIGCGTLAVVLLATAACSDMNDQQQRAVSGGAIGAGGGALFAAIIGANPLVGALVGGAGGAAVGALTSKDQANLNSSGTSHSNSNGASGANAGASKASTDVSQLTKNIQSGLSKLGYDPGAADGVSGPKTQTAIRQYQAHENLPVDGKVSEQLWQHMKGQLSET